MIKKSRERLEAADCEYGDQLWYARSRFQSQQQFADWLKQHNLLDEHHLEWVRKGEWLNDAEKGKWPPKNARWYELDNRNKDEPK